MKEENKTINEPANDSDSDMLELLQNAEGVDEKEVELIELHEKIQSLESQLQETRERFQQVEEWLSIKWIELQKDAVSRNGYQLELKEKKKYILKNEDIAKIEELLLQLGISDAIKRDYSIDSEMLVDVKKVLEESGLADSIEENQSINWQTLQSICRKLTDQDDKEFSIHLPESELTERYNVLVSKEDIIKISKPKNKRR